MDSLLVVPVRVCDSKQTLVGNQFSQSLFNKSHVPAVMEVRWSVECIPCTIIEVCAGSIFSWLWLRRLSLAAGATLHCTVYRWNRYHRGPTGGSVEHKEVWYPAGHSVGTVVARWGAATVVGHMGAGGITRAPSRWLPRYTTLVLLVPH